MYIIKMVKTEKNWVLIAVSILYVLVAGMFIGLQFVGASEADPVWSKVALNVALSIGFILAALFLAEFIHCMRAKYQAKKQVAL